MAALAARSGIGTVAAMITPQETQRVMIRGILAGLPVLWVWADCPVEECLRRDVKGLYRRQQAGELRNLTGMDGVFEAPGFEVLRVDTSALSVEESVDAVWRALKMDASPDGGVSGSEAAKRGKTPKRRLSARNLITPGVR